MERKQLIDFLIYVDENDLLRKPGMRDEIVDMYLKSINSRLSERRAIGSNSKAKEVCGSINFCRYQDEDGFCESKYKCHLRRKQTD